jgi:hypothetical protein
MIWLTWRQFRIQALAGLGVLVAVAVLCLATRPAVSGLARNTGFAGCAADCSAAADAFLRQAQTTYLAGLYYGGIIVMFGAPALIGLFWGAPLVARELEAGTHRLVWSQTVSRGRWLAVKLGAVGLAAALAAGLVSLVVTWWASPLDAAGGWMGADVFAARGVVPIGYATFAFLAGVTVGMLVRRTVPAMAVTLVVVAAAMVASPLLLRPHLAGRTTSTQAVTAANIRSLMLGVDDGSRSVMLTVEVPVRGAWVLGNDVRTTDGKLFRGPYDAARCGPDAEGGPKSCEEWLAAQNLHQRVVYLGQSAFWTLQWRELGVFLTVSVLLAVFCFWWIRRRVA